MLHNYIKIAIRNLLKYKSNTLISVAGLCLAFASSILILLFVMDELQYDGFHLNKERVFRVGTDMADIKTGAVNGKIETNGWPVGALLEKEYPEVEAMTYVRNASNLVVLHEGHRFEQRVFFAGKNFLCIFSFPLLSGNPSEALAGPNKVVISRSMAEKFFPRQDAMGKELLFADSLLFQVSGVMEDVPVRSHMQFDMLVSFETYERLNKEFDYSDGWGNLDVRNYILLKEGVDQVSFFVKARNLYTDRIKKDLEKYGMYLYLSFEPLSTLYLDTERGNGMGPVGSRSRLYMVSGIGIFIVLLACINFINLSTARSVYRSREVGLRKVVGSTRAALVRQFMTETCVISLLSFLLALLLAVLFLPVFNELMGKTFVMNAFFEPRVILGYAALVSCIAFLSGYYPSLILASFKPAQVLKGSVQSGLRGGNLRRTLVIFQFAISVSLIVGTLIVSGQLEFMKGRDLGFAKDQILVLNITRIPHDNRIKYEVFKQDLLQLPAVRSVTFTNALPGKPGWVGQWAHAADRSADETIGVEYMSIDEDYLKTLGLSLLAGDNFSTDRQASLLEGLIVNEETVRKMGWGSPDNALGKKIASPSGKPEGTVIGVVRNYHEFGLQREIYPMAMDYAPEYSRYYAIRVESAGMEQLLPELERLWKNHYEAFAFDYFFLDENFEKQYQAEKQLSEVFMIFTGMGIFIAMIGLIGMVAFMVNARTKEIGVRRILGANLHSLTWLLSSEFVVMAIVAFAVACPLAWYGANQWLQGFAYHMEISGSIFAITLIITIGLTLATISFQTIRAALADPVKSLRYE
ncbi:MAG: ABC transporter permease [Bacteroidetes bacterium]|nr:ABC transporter permease [Bacteroidota bacterium]